MPLTKLFLVLFCALGLPLGHAGRSYQHRTQDVFLGISGLHCATIACAGAFAGVLFTTGSNMLCRTASEAFLSLQGCKWAFQGRRASGDGGRQRLRPGSLTNHIVVQDVGKTPTYRASNRGNYAFSYNIEDPFGFSNGRWEVGDEFGNKRGGYTIAEPSGQSRYVEYVADRYGFRIVYQGSLPIRPSSPVERIASPDECTVHGAHHYGVCVPGRVLTQREIDYAPLIAMESYDAFESARLPREHAEPRISKKVTVAETAHPRILIPSYHHSKAVESYNGPIVTRRKLRIGHGRKRRRHPKKTKFVEAYA